MNTFSENLRRLRLAKKLTQEQAADSLGVSPQSISRWECGTTLPDVTILPQIAALYCVTIDDLYRETSVAYDNYAMRLGSVYEATRKPEDFLRADQEYQKLLKSGEYTANDLRSYGILHQYMMQYSMKKAESLFDRVLAAGLDADPEIYWQTQRQKNYFLSLIGRNKESIDAFLPLVEAGSQELNEWICLIQAYTFAEDNDAAWYWAAKAEQTFPENAILHIYCGDLCRAMKRYDEAFNHWKRALELEPEWCDSAYSMGFCYEELGDYEKAYEVWTSIADNLQRRGFDSEVIWPRQLAQKCKEKIKS